MAPKKTKKSAAPKKAKRSGGKRKAKETKAETVDVSNGVQLLLGHNLPKDDETIRDYEMLARLMDKAATANANVREHKSKMKDKGHDVKGFTDTMALERMDPLDVARRLQQQQQLFRLKGMPIQIGLFETKYGSVEAQARAEGLAAGRRGASMDGMRWVEGSPGYAEYVEGWQEGQKELVLGKQDRPEGHYEGAGDE